MLAACQEALTVRFSQSQLLRCWPHQDQGLVVAPIATPTRPRSWSYGTALVISGKIDERERVGVVRHHARRSGSFEYRTTLPAEIDPGRVDAKFDNGVLTVSVTRPERSKAHRIKIN